MVRERARLAVKGLAQLSARGAFVRQEDGSRHYLPTNELRPGMTILLAAGERVPVDATVTRGASEIDVSLVSGEHAPVPVAANSVLRAGTLKLTGPVTIVATATSGDSFLGEMVRMMEAAEQGRSGYRRIADRAASLYAPVVHLTALMTFVGWLIVTADVHHAMTTAIAVLIITCPCALGLAVPMVQVVAARRLFDAGIMVKDGGALERLAETDTIVFDKTGTLTVGVPRLVGSCEANRETTAIAVGLAAHSHHPDRGRWSRRVLAFPHLISRSTRFPSIPDTDSRRVRARRFTRLGRPEWALACATEAGWMPATNSSCSQKTATACRTFASRIDCGRTRQQRSPS